MLGIGGKFSDPASRMITTSNLSINLPAVLSKRFPESNDSRRSIQFVCQTECTRANREIASDSFLEIIVPLTLIFFFFQLSMGELATYCESRIIANLRERQFRPRSIVATSCEIRT
jgi:hypothetical protein